MIAQKQAFEVLQQIENFEWIEVYKALKPRLLE